MNVFISKKDQYYISEVSMTIQNENLVLEKINQLEEKINRIEQMLIFLMEEEHLLSEEEIQRIVEADKIVKEKAFDKLIPVK